MEIAITEIREPWQIAMFRRSLKKQLKLRALLKLLGDTTGLECLLVTCGDNNGALNWYFRGHGGIWTWGDVAGENIKEISELIREPVYHLPEEGFPFSDEQFDCVVSIDVLEHLHNDQPFLHELGRVLRPGGRAIVTVPNGDPKLLANRIKHRIGMTPDVYGHTRDGYTLEELRETVMQAGLEPIDQGGYSRFFTEMVELAINYGYVYILSRKSGGMQEGHIAPTTSKDMNQHGLAYQLYSLIFPLMQLISKLDGLLTSRADNAVIIKAVKPG